MNDEKIISVCKQISKSVNSLGDGYYTSESLQDELKISCCPYYIRASGVLLKIGAEIKRDGRRSFFKINKPVHYSVFVPTIKKRFEQRIRPKNCSSNINIDYSEDAGFSIFSDSEIAEELRRRGYEVHATKKIEL